MNKTIIRSNKLEWNRKSSQHKCTENTYNLNLKSHKNSEQKRNEKRKKQIFS